MEKKENIFLRTTLIYSYFGLRCAAAVVVVIVVVGGVFVVNVIFFLNLVLWF